MIRVHVTPKHEVCQAVEDLRGTHQALLAAAGFVGNEFGRNGEGAYHLLVAVAGQLDRNLSRLEGLTGCAP